MVALDLPLRLRVVGRSSRGLHARGDGCGTGTRFDGSEVTFTSDLRVWDLVNSYSAALFGRYIKGIEAYDEVLSSALAPEVNRHLADPGP